MKHGHTASRSTASANNEALPYTLTKHGMNPPGHKKSRPNHWDGFHII